MFSFGQISFLKKSQKTEKQKETKNTGPLKKQKKKKKKKTTPPQKKKKKKKKTSQPGIVRGPLTLQS